VTTSVVALDLEGPAAPPRSNGELVFSEPWESRIFGVAVSMHQAGCFEWTAFQAELMAAIARWESTHDVHDVHDAPDLHDPHDLHDAHGAPDLHDAHGAPDLHDAHGAPGGGEPFSYYMCWLEALESLLDRMGVVAGEQLRDRLAAQRSRPAGHDHDHDHDHG
jgi:hypothetical protein